jgi:diguanylate cyclase (GGDEF)-like protein
VSAATANTRRGILALAAAAYAGIFAAFVLFETPGLGIGHFFYVPIILIALTTNQAWGALTGALTAGLYVAAVELTSRAPSVRELTTSAGVRLVTFALVGTIIGLFASRNRQLVNRLTDLAGRDFVTGLGNARTFDEELAKRCAAEKPFALILADVDDLKEVNDVHGHAAGNAALRRVGEVIRDYAEPNDVIARLGGDEFALLTTLPLEQIAALFARVNRTLTPENLSVTFGTTYCPEDGQTAAELFHKADDRLFAGKLVRQNRVTVVALRDTAQ